MPEIPTLPELRPLLLDDAATFRALFAAQPPQQSELTFTNLFMWREAYALQVARVGGAVAVFSWRPDPEDSFVFPPLGEARRGDGARLPAAPRRARARREAGAGDARRPDAAGALGGGL